MDDPSTTVYVKVPWSEPGGVRHNVGDPITCSQADSVRLIKSGLATPYAPSAPYIPPVSPPVLSNAAATTSVTEDASIVSSEPVQPQEEQAKPEHPKEEAEVKPEERKDAHKDAETSAEHKPRKTAARKRSTHRKPSSDES